MRITNEKNKRKNEYGRKILRFLFALCAVVGAIELLGSFVAWLMFLSLPDPYLTMGEAASIGIIGGADGPTALLIAAPGWTHYVLPCLMIAIGIYGFIRLGNSKEK